MEIDLKHLRMTDDELDLFEWCHQNLDEEQIVEIEDQAIDIADRELNAPEAAEKLLELLVRVIVRNGQENAADSKGPKPR